MTMQTPMLGRRSPGSAVQVLHSVVTDRPGQIAIGAAVIGSGLALIWDSLVAIGAAPFILGILPCAAMCAVGLCMPTGGPRKREAVVIDAAAIPVGRDHEPLVIEATARARAVPSPSTFRSSPNP